MRAQRAPNALSGCLSATSRKRPGPQALRAPRAVLRGRLRCCDGRGDTAGPRTATNVGPGEHVCRRCGAAARLRAPRAARHGRDGGARRCRARCALPGAPLRPALAPPTLSTGMPCERAGAPARPLPRRDGAARRGARRESGCRDAGSCCAPAASARPFPVALLSTRSLLSDASRRARSPRSRWRATRACAASPPRPGASPATWGRGPAPGARRRSRRRDARAARPLRRLCRRTRLCHAPWSHASRLWRFSRALRLAAGPAAVVALRGAGLTRWRFPRSLAPVRPARAPERPRSCVQAVLSPPRPGGDAPYNGGAVDNEVLLREKDACGVGFIASVKARALLKSRPMQRIGLPRRAATRRGHAASAAALCAG
jgi:hypothetical protein